MKSDSPSIRTSGKLIKCGLALSFLTALSVNSFLAWHQMSQTGASGGIPGCSSGHGDCSLVLSSSYGKVFGQPVSMWATGYYLVAGVLLFWSFRSNGFRSRVALLGWSTLATVAGFWFIIVMKVVLGQWCPWCLTVHAMNFAFFCLATFFAASSWEEVNQQGTSREKRNAIRTGIVGGLVTIVLLAGQFAIYSMGSRIEPMKVVAFEGPESPLKQASLTENEIRTQKILSSSAVDPINVVIFTCPTCEACKQTNQILSQFQKQNPQIRVDVRFFPLSTQCNPDLARKYPDKQDSGRACQLTRIALAVASIDPSRFGSFLDWIYSNDKIEPAAAHAMAAELVGADELKQALASTSVNERLATDLQIAETLGVESVPAIFVEQGQVSGAMTPNNFFRLLQELLS